MIGSLNFLDEKYISNNLLYKIIGLIVSSLNLLLSFIIFVFFNSSTNEFQFVKEHIDVQLFDIYLGIDGLSIYFVLLTTIIMPIALISN
jgi:NADH-ubiquinone oxidoreductase chain 4